MEPGPTPPDREPQTPTQKLDTGPATAHKTFKNSSVYLDLVDSLGPQSTGLVGAVRWLWLRPAMRLGPAMFRSASLIRIGPFTDRRVLAQKRRAP